MSATIMTTFQFEEEAVESQLPSQTFIDDVEHPITLANFNAITNIQPPRRQQNQSCCGACCSKLFKKINLRSLTMWAAWFEMVQSLIFVVLWMGLAIVLLFEFDEWHRDLAQEPWVITNIPLTWMVFQQGFGFSILICAVLMTVNFVLGIVACSLLTAAEIKSYKDINKWISISYIICVLQFLNKMSLGLMHLDGHLLSAFLWVQIFFRLTTIGIARNYYDILELLYRSNSRDNLLMDEFDVL